MNYKKLLAPMMLATIVGSPSTVTAEEADLARSVVWSSYEVGSAGYLESAAIADPMMRQYGARIRVMPSGTPIGRMMPLKTDRAQFGWFGSESKLPELKFASRLKQVALMRRNSQATGSITALSISCRPTSPRNFALLTKSRIGKKASITS